LILIKVSLIVIYETNLRLVSSALYLVEAKFDKYNAGNFLVEFERQEKQFLFSNWEFLSHNQNAARELDSWLENVND